MKFRINSADYFSREEEKGTLSLIVRSTNQILFLNRSASKLMLHCDEWVDLDEFVTGLGITSVSPQKVRNDYENVLYELNAYSVADLKNREPSRLTGCRIAEISDYAALSDFMQKNLASGFSCAMSVNQAAYSLLSIYIRLRNKNEICLIYEEEGLIQAVISVSCSGKNAGYSVLSLDSAVFGPALSEAECKQFTRELTELASSAFRDSFSKIRYVYMNQRQQWLVKVLCETGFAQTAVFHKEIRRKQDVVFFDRFI